MNSVNADVLKVKIREICRSLGVTPRSDADLSKLIADTVNID